MIEEMYTFMETVQTTFTISFTNEQYEHARAYVEDMKKHPNRVFWIGKENKSDEELILSQIAHRTLSGFYNNYENKFGTQQIEDMINVKP